MFVVPRYLNKYGSHLLLMWYRIVGHPVYEKIAM